MARRCRGYLPLVALAMVASMWISGGTAEGLSSSANVGAPAGDDSTICFIIRTFWGHGDTWGDKSLRRMLTSLQNQTSDRWEAMLVVMDNRPFPELRRIVRQLNDSRIWVHAEWVNYKYNPKKDGAWAPTYHNKLYNLTDIAVRACPERARWVVITNGDNEYDTAFVETIFAAPPGIDVVAVDFYSRYQRPTADPCERFEDGEGAPPCKVNEMRFCQTDLAANAYRLERLLEEDRRFGLVDPNGTHGANDGIMAQMLKTAGWKIHYVHGRCLINHAPSPQQCALAGGVWDDSVMCLPSSFGGGCVTAKSVADRMRTNPDLYELLELNVTYDRGSFAYAAHPFIELRCLRVANRSAWFQVQTFGRVCTATFDVPSLPAVLPPHPWDAWVPPPEVRPPEGAADVQEDEDSELVEWHASGEKDSQEGSDSGDGEEHVEL
ncbi:hypothetical protein TSOC_013878 [Tetrabaena socialis]|uniref:Uncharacterized protein n=1 Tax=Tetrabaena socialis TaxID=47790 RepID=A0A2J7ZJ66_9CHLO|nr:hypothetical protein TSOC_013878 [Tetrabaena socialis]|eukprot:PNH00307.1 hypothetical protein TSOC_013878 [Tetrabaena socialis]